LALCSDLLIFICLGEGGSIAWYHIVLVYHLNTQYHIKLPLPGIAQLYFIVTQKLVYYNTQFIVIGPL